jgi:hypothetical protein
MEIQMNWKKYLGSKFSDFLIFNCDIISNINYKGLQTKKD